MADTPEPFAVGLARKGADGSISQRVWLVQEPVAVLIAAILGPPHMEQLADGQGAEMFQQAFRDSGVVLVNHLEEK